MSAAASARRLPDWPERLDAYVCAMRDRPFAWGACDCVSFACGAFEAITGTRPALPKWGSARRALRLLAQRGGIEGAAGSVLPLRCEPAQARRGDILLVPQLSGPALAVCLGAQWACPGGSGLVFGPTQLAVAAWKVG